LTQHPLFEKYTLWLMTDKTAPQAGQIAPALAHIGPESTESDLSEKQTG
ncbi:transcriptional regulator, partial [Klebsiella pneumoniae]